MEHFDTIEWSVIWSIIKDIVMPHTWILTSQTLIFLFFGFILSIFYIIILNKKKVLTRNPKYYNWAVKVYIPTLIVGFLFVFGYTGFITGVYKVMNKEKETIVSSVYNHVLKLSFESENSKNEFIVNLQISAIVVKGGSKVLLASLKKTTSEYNSGYSIIDDNKNKLANYLIDKYADDIYKIVIYGMLDATGAKANINIEEELTYDDFSTGMDLLLDLDYKDIEQGIKDKLLIWFDDLLYKQYKSLLYTQLILLLIIMSLPLIEFLIYKKWIEPKYPNQLIKKQNL
ncbi:hypothetical protein [Psychroserpens sp. NJDZ02]|uniref:hypothetical protein n=1 Tax=Psychroserpens sp. NJDZ02 TaxID=2570561 RepID=UPI0010A904F5|nr:hypothetical protein [Psychroserpens sp. NJDZ02]QCE40056.1 hypothetical protein E9099_01000 [Psychroserpens sp. NJDZ02]